MQNIGKDDKNSTLCFYMLLNPFLVLVKVCVYNNYVCLVNLLFSQNLQHLLSAHVLIYFALALMAFIILEPL